MLQAAHKSHGLQCLSRINASLRAPLFDACMTDPKMRMSMITGCYHTDPSLFQCVCHPEDFCVSVGQQYTFFEDSVAHGQIHCPLPDPIIERGLQRRLACMFIPKCTRFQRHSVQRQQLTSERLLTLFAGPGQWNCSTASWQPVAVQRPLGCVPSEGLPYPVDAFVTFGDSHAANIASALVLMLQGYNSSSVELRHDRTSFGYAPSNTSLPLVQHYRFTATTANEVASAFKKWLTQRAQLAHVLMIMHLDMHDMRLNASAEAYSGLLRVAGSLQTLQRKVETLWLRTHGAGARKPKKMFGKYASVDLGPQQTSTLRKFDADLVRSIRPSPMHVLDPFSLAQAAECFEESRCSCRGAYESYDGTHLSPTSVANIAVLLVELAAVLFGS
mmetsp:Transcript_10828/g.18158  ORF Transcript_10828/g.18158 Transcript_10828/m.18158 type:complete len:387 (-) Transcript_10828:103-1263(-)